MGSIAQDSCTPPFPISSSFPIFGVSRTSYIISSSFVTSFDVESGCDPNLNFNLAPISTAQNAMVGAFYADWDSTNLNGISTYKHGHYTGPSPMDGVVGITSAEWFRVTVIQATSFQGNSAGRKNTFQQITMSDGESTFVCFIYPNAAESGDPEGGISWTASDYGGGSGGINGNLIARAGYADGFGISYEMPESGTEAMRSLDGVSAGAPPATSESIAEGLYCFEITNALGGCDESTECDGVSRGIGACGNECPSTCGATEVCSGNTCVCDVANECNGVSCGIGACGNECPSTCGPTEVCSGNTCVCDVANECNEADCGTGFCGGECPNTCDSDTEICSGNTCICDVSRECDNAECGTGFCGGECPNTCNSPLSCDRQICLDTFDGNSQCINLGNPCPFVNKCHNHECIDIDGIVSCDLSIIDCDDGNECTIDSCSPSSGCTYDEITCDDGDRCTSEYCDPNFGCVIENDVDCDDGNPCTIDYCDEMRGCQITWKDCDDNNPCTIDSCDELTGDCKHEEKICTDPETHCSEELFGECISNF